MSKVDKHDIEKTKKDKTKAPNVISCGVTWVDGRSIFVNSKYIDKQGQFWYGICHFSEKIWAVSPLDFDKPIAITTILVSPADQYCERAYSCINKTCILNRFDRHVFEGEYEGSGLFAKEFPRSMENKVIWFNEDPQWSKMWKRYILPNTGGTIRFNEEKAKEVFKEK